MRFLFCSNIHCFITKLRWADSEYAMICKPENMLMWLLFLEMDLHRRQFWCESCIISICSEAIEWQQRNKVKRAMDVWDFREEKKNKQCAVFCRIKYKIHIDKIWNSIALMALGKFASHRFCNKKYTNQHYRQSHTYVFQSARWV